MMKHERVLKDFSALSFEAGQVTNGSKTAIPDSRPGLTPESVPDFNVQNNGAAKGEWPEHDGLATTRHWPEPDRAEDLGTCLTGKLLSTPSKFLHPMNNALLLVSDDRWLTESVREGLPAQLFQLLATNEVKEALRIADSDSLAAVLLDLDLNKGGAWHEAEQILVRNPFLPLVLLARRSRQVGLAAGVRAGMVLEKPIKAERLGQVLTTLLSQPKQERLLRNASQHNFLRYAQPFTWTDAEPSMPRHWGLNE
jgi:FixJ family two-component response regulator